MPIFEHSFWKKEQFSGGKDILYCFDVKNKMQSGDSCAILKNKKEGIFAGYASNNKVIRQLIDLALLQNNMLKGEALNNFVKRSIELI